MKIYHVIDNIDLNSGGPSRSLPNLCIGLLRLGIKSCLFTYKTSHPNEDLLNKNGIPICYAVREKNIFSKLLSSNFKFDLKDNDNVIVHLHQIWSPCIHFFIKNNIRGAFPYLISPRGMLEPWALQQKKWKKKLGLSCYQFDDLKNACCIHATAKSELQSIRSLGLKNPVAVIPNGININNYPLKSAMPKESEKRTLLFLSRIHPKKGLDLLFSAFSQLPNDIKSKWQINIVGDGDKEYGLHDLQNLVQSKYSDLPIRILGPQYGAKKMKCYQEADLFILPTYSENFGMVVAEAMCCGLPVITTTGAPWEIIKTNKCGWWVEPTVKEIYQALSEALIQTHEELTQKGLISRELICKNFSTESVSEKYNELYKWILGMSAKPNFVFV